MILCKSASGAALRASRGAKREVRTPIIIRHQLLIPLSRLVKVPEITSSDFFFFGLLQDIMEPIIIITACCISVFFVRYHSQSDETAKRLRRALDDDDDDMCPFPCHKLSICDI